MLDRFMRMRIYAYAMMELQDIRERLGLSQAELAAKLGLHQSTISRFERGELPIDRRTELAIAALMAGAEES